MDISFSNKLSDYKNHSSFYQWAQVTVLVKRDSYEQ